jgi:hypothetical protein
METSGKKGEKILGLTQTIPMLPLERTRGDGRTRGWKPGTRKRAMTTETNLQWQVVRGFGDIVDAPDSCFDVEVVATFKSEADAQVFADMLYETNIEDVQSRMPDWWKSFFVTARRANAGPSPSEVAARFDAVLREWLTAGDYAEMLRRNRNPEYRDSCASHDFTDANMAMCESLRQLGIETDSMGDDGPTATLWNAAWQSWRASH